MTFFYILAWHHLARYAFLVRFLNTKHMVLINQTADLLIIFTHFQHTYDSMIPSFSKSQSYKPFSVEVIGDMISTSFAFSTQRVTHPNKSTFSDLAHALC